MNKSIQGLRGFAAILVVMHHAFLSSGKYYSPDRAFNMNDALIGIGEAGVDIFFVISGYIMLLTRGDEFGRPGAATRFLKDRVLRVAPMYWLFTSISIALTLMLPSLSSANVTPETIISSLTFFPLEKHPILKVGWSLNYEMYFYLVFSCLLLTKKTIAAMLATSFLVVSICLGTLLPPENGDSLYLPYLITDSILLEFAAGAAIAISTKKYSPPSKLVGALLALLAVVWAWIACVLFPGEESRLIRWGIPGCLLVIAATVPFRMRRAMERLSLGLGDASYAIYLSHPFIIPVFGLLWIKFGLHAFSPVLYAASCVCVSTCIGFAIHKLLEVRLNASIKAAISARA